MNSSPPASAGRRFRLKANRTDAVVAGVGASYSRFVGAMKVILPLAAAVLVVLLTHDTARQSAVGQALAAGAAGVSQVIGVPSQASARGAVTGPQTTLSINGATSEGTHPRLTSQVAIEAVGFLVGVLFLLVMLFIGQGVLWHGLVVTFGMALLMFAVMRPPSPIDVADPSETATVSDESAGVTSPGAEE